MKKSYEAPKAERMEFRYSETVVASGSPCDNITPMTQQNTVEGERCTTTPADDTQYLPVFPIN